MTLYVRKPVVVEILSFDELVALGRIQRGEEHLHGPNKMPWHFEWREYYFTHENDSLYLGSKEGRQILVYQGSYVLYNEEDGGHLQAIEKKDLEDYVDHRELTKFWSILKENLAGILEFDNPPPNLPKET